MEPQNEKDERVKIFLKIKSPKKPFNIIIIILQYLLKIR